MQNKITQKMRRTDWYELTFGHVVLIAMAPRTVSMVDCLPHTVFAPIPRSGVVALAGPMVHTLRVTCIPLTPR